MTCTEEAQQELRAQERPELKEYLESIDGYDNIFVCGPCWWGTYPMAIFSQLDRLDLSGKTVTALMTHEGSGLGSCERDLKKYCANAIMKKGIAVQGGRTANSEGKIAAWAKEVVK